MIFIELLSFDNGLIILNFIYNSNCVQCIYKTCRFFNLMCYDTIYFIGHFMCKTYELPKQDF